MNCCKRNVKQAFSQRTDGMTGQSTRDGQIAFVQKLTAGDFASLEASSKRRNEWPTDCG